MTVPPGGEAAAREELCRLGRELRELGLLAGTAGNLSARLHDGRILVTPAGGRKGRLDASDLVVVDPADPGSAARRAASSELPLHLACYRARAGVGSVVHTHAPALTAAGLRELDIADRLPELTEAVGPIRLLPFAPSGSAELARAAEEAVGEGAGVLLLRGHGAVAVGRDPADAGARTELAELSAYAVLLARSAGFEIELRPVLRLHERLAGRALDGA